MSSSRARAASFLPSFPLFDPCRRPAKTAPTRGPRKAARARGESRGEARAVRVRGLWSLVCRASRRRMQATMSGCVSLARAKQGQKGRKPNPPPKVQHSLANAARRRPTTTAHARAPTTATSMPSQLALPRAPETWSPLPRARARRQNSDSLTHSSPPLSPTPPTTHPRPKPHAGLRPPPPMSPSPPPPPRRRLPALPPPRALTASPTPAWTTSPTASRSIAAGIRSCGRARAPRPSGR